MFLLLFSLFASAQECPQIYGHQQSNGAWIFYQEQLDKSGSSYVSPEGTVLVPKAAIGADCEVDWEILEMKSKKMAVSETKKEQMRLKKEAEDAQKLVRKSLKDKAKAGTLSDAELKEVIKLLEDKI